MPERVAKMLRGDRGRLLPVLLLLLTLFAPAASALAREPDLVLEGTLTRADHETYRSVPFTVPPGVVRLAVDFSYEGRDERTTVDLGLFDPERFRGWSGGNKQSFTLSAEDATPSYLPGSITPGRWSLLLGVPNIREGARSDYTAKISFTRAGDDQRSRVVAKQGAAGERWYRGDLHTHTGHSDGSCESQTGARVPCPLYRTVEAASARGLDFIAITDHNTTSHHADILSLQPAFDRLLIIPGREITTFRGHANIFGVRRFVDFRLTSRDVPDVQALLDAVSAEHGLFSINHPAVPSGEACMGCGWSAENTDPSRIGAVEVMNGSVVRQGGVEGPLSGLPFWEALLDRGHRVTAIGGSDNHDALMPPSAPNAIGRPTTVVRAAELSEAAILDAIRAGHVFIDVGGTANRLLSVSARVGDVEAAMGDVAKLAAGDTARFKVDVHGVTAPVIEVIESGSGRRTWRLPPGTFDFPIRGDGRRKWVRVNVRSADGTLLLIGNPIYLVARD